MAIRVGVNEGCVVERRDGPARLADRARPLDELMVEKLAEYLRSLRGRGLRRPGPLGQEPRRLHHAWPPTASWRGGGTTRCTWASRTPATPRAGTVRSAAALGALLAEGIGDTVRICFAGDPVQEVLTAVELLESLRLRPRRRARTDRLPHLRPARGGPAGHPRRQSAPALADTGAGLRVAVMGCVVNGPGEADGADVAVCCGKGKGVIYVDGQVVQTVSQEQIVRAVVERVRKYGQAASGGE